LRLAPAAVEAPPPPLDVAGVVVAVVAVVVVLGTLREGSWKEKWFIE
jgi:uncharacterized RDD family membrane protein YckC